jgi:hypothetical protein
MPVPKGITTAVDVVPVLNQVITNDHAHIAIPPSPIIPVDPCAPVIEHLFGPLGTAPPTDLSFG